MSFKAFVQEHKTEIAVGATVAVGIGALLYFKRTSVLKAAAKAANAGKDQYIGTKGMMHFIKPEVIEPTPQLSAFGFKDVDKYAAEYEAMSEMGLRVSDLGKLGDAMTGLDGVAPENPVFILFNVKRATPKAPDELVLEAIKTAL